MTFFPSPQKVTRSVFLPSRKGTPITFPEARQCGRRLKAARKASGLPIGQLTSRVGVSIPVWVAREEGHGWKHMRLRKMERLADAVGISIDDLVPAELRRVDNPLE